MKSNGITAVHLWISDRDRQIRSSECLELFVYFRGVWY